jgi:hypothetical protein
VSGPAASAGAGPGGPGAGAEDEGLGAQADMQLAAAALLADSSDVKMMLRLLAKNLQDNIGNAVEVGRSGGLLHRQGGEVRNITVHLRQDDFQADLDSHPVRCTVGRSSGGVRIRNEELPVEEWLSRLLAALKEEAVHNQAASNALQNVIIGGGL